MILTDDYFVKFICDVCDGRGDVGHFICAGSEWVPVGTL
jgi:hypothetical protein